RTRASPWGRTSPWKSWSASTSPGWSAARRLSRQLPAPWASTSPPFSASASVTAWPDPTNRGESMPLRHLHTRFILAGCLLVATTVGCGLWSALTFARLSAAAADDVRESQETIDLSAELAGLLEREDDALLAVAGRAGGTAQLTARRARSDD